MKDETMESVAIDHDGLKGASAILHIAPEKCCAMKSHYDTLGVAQSASKDEIKKAFRRLSLETHPDVSDTGCNERFKQVNEAHRILSNDLERRLYNEAMHSPSWEHLRDGRRGFRHASAGANTVRPYPQHHPSFMHAFFDGLGRPRNIALGLTVGISTVCAVQFAFGTKERAESQKTEKIEAWFNPETQQFEPPSPWDPTYRKLKPSIQLVPREQVRHRPH